MISEKKDSYVLSGFLKKYWLGALIYIIFLLAFPILLNNVFRVPTSYKFLESDLSVGDLLSYFGGLFTTTLAIIGILLSITEAKKDIDEQHRNGVLPYFGYVIYNVKRNIPIFQSIESLLKQKNEKGSETLIPIDTQSTYSEIYPNEAYIVLDDGDVQILQELSKEQKKKTQLGTFRFVRKGAVQTVVSEEFVWLPIVFENIGNGASINLKFEVVNKSSKKKAFIVFTSIMKSQNFRCGIYCDEQNNKSLGEYEIILSYYDIYSNLYQQNIKFEILKEKINENEKSERVCKFYYTQKQKYLDSSKFVFNIED